MQREGGLALQWPLADHGERVIDRASYRIGELPASRQFFGLAQWPCPRDQQTWARMQTGAASDLVGKSSRISRRHDLLTGEHFQDRRPLFSGALVMLIDVRAPVFEVAGQSCRLLVVV